MNEEQKTAAWYWAIGIAIALLYAVFYFVAMQQQQLKAHEKPTRSDYHDASLDLETQPVRTTQEYYEREKRAGRD